MTTPPDVTGPPLAGAAASAPPDRISPWRPTRGTWTVVRLELRQRVRSTRWQVALAVWFVVLGALATLVWLSARPSDVVDSGYGLALHETGPYTFGLVVFCVLGLGLLVAPALAAGGVNGDRAAGTLATLQLSRLTACDIALGKLLAAWLVSLAFLAVSLPYIVWALAQGGTRVAALLVCLGVLALELGVVCAIGLGFSALVSRTIGSTMLTYLVVAALAGGTALTFALASTLTTVTEPTRTYGLGPNVGGWYIEDSTSPSASVDATPGSDPTPDQCHWYVTDKTLDHTERIWWLLAANPFVIVADAAPEPAWQGEVDFIPVDPLGEIRQGVREARLGAASEVDDCISQTAVGPSYRSPVPERDPSDAPVWPWGLAVNVLLGAGGFALAVRRLTIPYRRLPKATRVA